MQSGSRPSQCKKQLTVFILRVFFSVTATFADGSGRPVGLWGTLLQRIGNFDWGRTSLIPVGRWRDPAGLFLSGRWQNLTSFGLGGSWQNRTGLCFEILASKFVRNKEDIYPPKTDFWETWPEVDGNIFGNEETWSLGIQQC
jgi:hypothetical protein